MDELPDSTLGLKDVETVANLPSQFRRDKLSDTPGFKDVETVADLPRHIQRLSIDPNSEAFRGSKRKSRRGDASSSTSGHLKVHGDKFGLERRPLVLPRKSKPYSLCIRGDLVVYMENGQFLETCDLSNGLPPDFQFDNIVKMETECKLVLLVPTTVIWGTLKRVFSQYSPESDDFPILRILIQWDKQTYLYLRKLRESMSSEALPFVACSDMVNYHLDLFTFLDTPPEDVKEYYGWDLIEDCERANVSHIKKLDIKWMGMRPSDIEKYPCDRSKFDWHYSSCCEYMTDFEFVNAQLMKNPHFRAKKEWVNELEQLKSLPQPKPMYRPFYDIADKDNFTKKFSDCDWI